MKILMIIIALVGFQSSSMSAPPEGEGVAYNPILPVVCPECPFLIPEVPAEATFEDINEFEILPDPSTLVPEVPIEAGFDQNDNAGILLSDSDLTPVVPQTAGFSDNL